MVPLITAEQGTVYLKDDGNFLINRESTSSKVLRLTKQRFAQIFGRLPRADVFVRADNLIRLCRLAGMVFHFSDPSFTEARNPKDGSYQGPMLRGFDKDEDEFAKAPCLYLNDEGNFNLTVIENDHPSYLGWACVIPTSKFDSMFGSEPRDYFSSEVLRVIRLAGLEVSLF